MPTILIADDEPVILKVMQKLLDAPGRKVITASSAEQALRLARANAPVDLALVDKNFGEANGLQVGKDLKAIESTTEVILVTGYASLQSAIEAVQIGAYDYVTKPIEDLEGLRLKVTNALEKVRLGREHHAMSEQLSESEARYRQLFDGAPDAMIAFEASREQIEVANTAALAVFGYAEEELLQLTASELFAPPRPIFGGAWVKAVGTEQVRCLRKSGEAFAAEIRPGTVTLNGRTFCNLSVRDVSERERLAAERREAEETLRHAQKMDALGRLAGGIGHDLGNMLAVILSYVEELIGKSQGETREDLEAVQNAAERSTHLVRQMMTLSRKGPAIPAVFVMNGAIAAMTKLLRRSIGESIELVTELAPDLWPVNMDQGHLGQVLLNLAVNARDAMPDGGRLVIRTENLAGDAWPLLRGETPPGDKVALTVTDTGTGMTAEVRERLFEPFFTTKERGKGTGLGLAVTYGIVTQAAGQIAVDSEPGKGATFRILLPRAGPQLEAGPERTAAQPAPAAGPWTVLLAEDEDALRTLIARTLARKGFTVLEGKTGEQALEVARQYGKPIDLLLADVVMARMSGTELAESMLSEHPLCRVLLMTGFPSDARVAMAVERGGVVLYKPFQQTQLLEHVQRVLPRA